MPTNALRWPKSPPTAEGDPLTLTIDGEHYIQAARACDLLSTGTKLGPIQAYQRLTAWRRSGAIRHVLLHPRLGAYHEGDVLALRAALIEG